MNDALTTLKQVTLELYEAERLIAHVREKYQAALAEFNKTVVEDALATKPKDP